MKKRNGFTLVELMGIMVILTLIVLIAVPAITGMLRGQRRDRLEQYKEQICDAAITHINLARNNEEVEDADRNLYHRIITGTNPSDRTPEIEVNFLVENGYLAGSTRHPERENNNGVRVVVLGSSSGAVCEYTGV